MIDYGKRRYRVMQAMKKDGHIRGFVTSKVFYKEYDVKNIKKYQFTDREFIVKSKVVTAETNKKMKKACCDDLNSKIKELSKDGYTPYGELVWRF